MYYLFEEDSNLLKFGSLFKKMEENPNIHSINIITTFNNNIDPYALHSIISKSEKFTINTELIIKLIQTKTKYTPTIYNPEPTKPSDFDYVDRIDENTTIEDLIGWSISDPVPKLDCKTIKYVGISFYKEKISNSTEKTKTEIMNLD